MRRNLKCYRVHTHKIPSGDPIILKMYGRSKQEIRERFTTNDPGWSYAVPRLNQIFLQGLN